MKPIVFAAFVAMAACASPLFAESINPVVTFSGGTTGSDFNPYTAGYEFTLTTTYDVDALGYLDDGAGYSHAVGIWDSNGTLLGSTTVISTDPAQDDFLWAPINLVLGPGTYVIGGQTYEDGNDYSIVIDPSSVTTLSGYTYDTDLQLAGLGLNFPTYSTGGDYGANGILTVDFSAGGSPVPEPSSLLLLGSGLAGLVGVVRRKLRV